MNFRGSWLAALLGAGLALAMMACQNDTPTSSKEMAYVAGSAVEFRSELGPDTKVVGHLQSGDRVEILSRRPRWAEVRGATGQAGWVLQRYLVPQEIYDQFATLYRDAEVRPSQGRVEIRHEANLHITPGRSSQVFYQLSEKEEAEVVGHRAVPRGGDPEDPAESPSEQTPKDVARNSEDWLLLRASRGRAGWVLETSADMNPPLEVAQYREGLRIRGWFELYRESDGGVEHPWYLWATSRSPGAAYDYDEIRVFVWDPRQSRYETSYRERGLNGFYPISVGTQQTAEGTTPTFRLQLQTPDGQRISKDYFMLGRQVRSAR